MSPHKVRRKYVRHLIVWGTIAGVILALGLIWPVVPLVIGAVLGVVVGVSALIFGLPCLVMAISHFLSSGYWVNPLRFGPWGDWKNEL